MLLLDMSVSFLIALRSYLLCYWSGDRLLVWLTVSLFALTKP